MAIDAARLSVLARDRTNFGRGRLLHVLSNELLSDRANTRVELEIFYDIVRVLLPGVSLADRRLFSEKAAERAAFPRDLLMELAHDQITVAEPVLLHAVDFTESDLIDIVVRQGDGHRLAVATRAEVPGAVTEVLIHHGSRAVLHRLGSNRGADFTDDAVRAIQQRAEDDGDLYRILQERRDLTEILARAMRHTLAKIADAAPEIEAEEDGFASSLDPPRLARRPLGPPPSLLAEMVRRGERDLDEVVVELADADRHADLTRLLGDIGRIDETQVMRVLVRADSIGIATVARGLGLTEGTFARIVELRRRRLKFSESQAHWEGEHFLRLDPAEARVTLETHGGRRNRA
ncbi:MAG: DUF2336 domain-containing protein [Siculibacillus sp.]